MNPSFVLYTVWCLGVALITAILGAILGPYGFAMSIATFGMLIGSRDTAFSDFVATILPLIAASSAIYAWYLDFSAEALIIIGVSIFIYFTIFFGMGRLIRGLQKPKKY